MRPVHIFRAAVRKYAAFLFLVVALAACDSADPNSDENPAGGPPVANAGADRTIEVGDAVSLDGSQSTDPDGDPLTFAWTILSEPTGSNVALSNPSVSKPGFTASVAGDYVFRLEVTAGSDKDTDEVTITAEEEGQTGNDFEINTDIEQPRVLTDRFEDPTMPDYVVTTGVKVHALLTVEPNVVVAFQQNASLTVEDAGGIRAEGTADERIVFRGIQSAPGYWGGIIIRTNSMDNVLDYVDVTHGGMDYGNLMVGYLAADNARVTVRNSTFSHSANYGIWVEDGGRFRAFENNTVSNNHDAPLYAPLNSIGVLDASTTMNDNGSTSSKNYVQLYGQDVDEAMTWPALNGTPYLIEGMVKVDQNVLIEAGANFLMGQSASIYVEGGASITAIGTGDKRIEFRGVQASRGYWEGIVVRTNSVGNVFDYVDILHGGSSYGSLTVGYLAADNARVKLTNSTIGESANYGIWIEDNGRFAEFGSNVITGNSDGAIYAPLAAIDALDSESMYGGNDKNEVRVYGQTLDEEATWANLTDAVYMFEGTFRITAPVTIEAGADFRFASNASLWIDEGGSLKAIGTSTEQITFQGAEASPGYWFGIIFRSNSQNNVLEHVIVSEGGRDYGNVTVGYQSADRAVVQIRNSTLRNSAHYGAYVMSSNATYTPTNVVYADNAEGDVRQP